MRRFFNFVAGAFIGAVVGSLTALLLAPYSGDQLRNQFNDRLEGFRQEMNSAYQTRRAQLEAELEALRQGQAEETE
jgi:gas vesicle protein